MQTFQSVYILSQQDLTRDRISWLKTTTVLNPLRHNMAKHVIMWFLFVSGTKYTPCIFYEMITWLANNIRPTTARNGFAVQ